MAKTNEKKFLYNDVTERFKLMNQFYIFSTTAMWALFLLFMWMKLAVRSIAPIVVYANTVLIVIFIIFAQLFIVYSGITIFGTTRINMKEIFVIFMISLTIIPCDIIRKIFLKWLRWDTLV